MRVWDLPNSPPPCLVTYDKVVTGAVDCLSLAIHRVLTELSLLRLPLPILPRDPRSFSFSVSLSSVEKVADLPLNMKDASDLMSGDVLDPLPQDEKYLDVDCNLEVEVEDADVPRFGVEELFA